ncbi:MAG: hypothetical protein AAF766_18835 [Cyanobacteria bacterium P01_D01_bin.14]
MITHISVQVSVESLIAAISSLPLEDKHRLLDVLEAQVFSEEETHIEDAEIEAARAAHAAGDYRTFDDYLESQPEKAS